MTAGRPRHQQPATAYDVHRAITLVQVLALEPSHTRNEGLLALCDGWRIKPAIIEDEPLVLDVPATIHALARHALEYSRTQPEILPDCAGSRKE